jgi:hypothetical protein
MVLEKQLCSPNDSLSTTDPKWTGLMVLEKQLCYTNNSLSTTNPKWTGLIVLEKQTCYPNEFLSTTDPKWTGLIVLEKQLCCISTVKHGFWYTDFRCTAKANCQNRYVAKIRAVKLAEYHYSPTQVQSTQCET